MARVVIQNILFGPPVKRLHMHAIEELPHDEVIEADDGKKSKVHNALVVAPLAKY